jgi:PHD/YefM family antitoxin component YafN of YafNO toxin-antitoxin module
MKGVFMVVNAQIIKKNGKKEFAILPYEEFQEMQEELASYEDLRCLREAKTEEKDASTIGIAELKKRIAGRTSKSPRPRKLGG